MAYRVCVWAEKAVNTKKIPVPVPVVNLFIYRLPIKAILDL